LLHALGFVLFPLSMQRWRLQVSSSATWLCCWDQVQRWAALW
jgi:hypothetical protein